MGKTVKNTKDMKVSGKVKKRIVKPFTGIINKPKNNNTGEDGYTLDSDLLG